MTIHRFRSGLIAVTILMHSLGCEQSLEQPIVTSPADTAIADPDVVTAPQPDIQAPADESLTVDAYIRLGMPSHDRVWSGADMSQAARILQALSQQNPEQLPRYQSERSSPVFARMNADQNLEIYRDKSLPLDQRIPDALQYMQSNNHILKLYLAAFNQQAVGGAELVELMGALLRVTVIQVQLFDEFVPTLDKNDPTYPVRMQGVAKMKLGMATLVAGNLQTLTESYAFRTADLKRLVGYLQNTLPLILPALTESSRSEIIVRLRSYSDDSNMKHLQPELDALVAVAEEFADPSPPR